MTSPAATAAACVCEKQRDREGEGERMLNLHGILNGIHGGRLDPHCQGKWSQGTLHFCTIKEQR